MKAHLVNCTYCVHRCRYPNAKEKRYELELCGLTKRPIPHPSQPGRFCARFHQVGHDCDNCAIGLQK